MSNASGLGVNQLEHKDFGLKTAGTSLLLPGLPNKQIRVMGGRVASPDEVSIYFTDGVKNFEGETWLPESVFILPPVDDVRLAHYVCGVGKPLSIVLSNDSTKGVAGFLKYCYTGFTGTDDPALQLDLIRIRDSLGGQDLGNDTASLWKSISLVIGG